MNFNPLALIADILQVIAKQLAGQSSDVLKQAASGSSKIATRIVDIAGDLLTGKLDNKDEALALIAEQYQELKIIIETAIGAGELAAEQIPNDVVSAVENVVFGSIGHLL